MTDVQPFGHVDFDVHPPPSGTPRRTDPFTIAVLGDFRGDAWDAARPLAERSVLPVDRDDVGRVLAHLAPAADLELPGAEGRRVRVAFEELDDFHPDRLRARLPAFRALRELRRRLEDPASFDAAAERVRALLGGPPPRASDAPAAEPDPGQQFVEDLLSGPAGDPLGVAAWVRSVVSQHVQPGDDPDLEALVGQVDEATSHLMRAVLHHPRFQELEASWRGLAWLTEEVETGESTKLGALDLTREELATDLLAADRLDASGLFKVLVERSSQAPGDRPWTAVVVLHPFDGSLEDGLLLGRLCKVARAAGAVVLGGATPAVVGCPSFGKRPDPHDWEAPAGDAATVWTAMRHQPDARHAALLAPRVLLRRPYGAKTDPVSTFAFEELPGKPRHEDYLWGSGALAGAVVLARAFARDGWSMEVGGQEELTDMPTHAYHDGIESLQQPSAEAWLSDRAGHALIEAGLSPLASVKNSTTVRLLAMRSIAEPRAPLAGAWHRG